MSSSDAHYHPKARCFATKHTTLSQPAFWISATHFNRKGLMSKDVMLSLSNSLSFLQVSYILSDLLLILMCLWHFTYNAAWKGQCRVHSVSSTLIGETFRGKRFSPGTITIKTSTCRNVSCSHPEFWDCKTPNDLEFDSVHKRQGCFLIVFSQCCSSLFRTVVLWY